MKKVEFYVSTNLVGSKETEVIEFEEDITEELEEYFKEWVWNRINAGFNIKD